MNLKTGTVSTVAGDYNAGDHPSGILIKEALAFDTRLNNPYGLTLNYNESTRFPLALYVSDTNNHKVRKIEFNNTANFNFSLGIIFVCLSSYILFAYLSDLLQIINFSEKIRSLLFYGGTLVLSNMTMSLWIVKNSTNKVF